MAGTILISEGAGLPLNSVTFDHLVEDIRGSLVNPANTEFSDAYRPYDQEGMMFIDLKELSADAFSAFVAATRLAAHACAHSHGEAFDRAWNELASALAKDPRFGAAEQSV